MSRRRREQHRTEDRNRIVVMFGLDFDGERAWVRPTRARKALPGLVDSLPVAANPLMLLRERR